MSAQATYAIATMILSTVDRGALGQVECITSLNRSKAGSRRFAPRMHFHVTHRLSTLNESLVWVASLSLHC
ncbi:hypothetical protein M433DRAFT_402953 [Acidomyces richmondensis BFW]|nr:MAG: hypothetical protein FE78DRAFT_441942 [Acidomyces sp. 'richmondensis']KYG42569.1 hypothetical protein M433DRAFT_402953 [Acidomyces richmondensis BFW]